MTRGVVVEILSGDRIKVKVMDHVDGGTGMYEVSAVGFEVIGHQKKFDRPEVLELLKNGYKKAILDYDLSDADLSDADLSGADLSGADLDFSCLPLRCGGLRWKIDKRLACQLAYHLCSMQCDDKEYLKMRDSVLGFANQFHRVNECGRLNNQDKEECLLREDIN